MLPQSLKRPNQFPWIPKYRKANTSLSTSSATIKNPTKNDILHYNKIKMISVLVVSNRVSARLRCRKYSSPALTSCSGSYSMKDTSFHFTVVPLEVAIDAYGLFITSPIHAFDDRALSSHSSNATLSVSLLVWAGISTTHYRRTGRYPIVLGGFYGVPAF